MVDYTWANGLLSQQDSPMLADGLGSVRALANAQGQIVGSFAYDTFGNAQGTAGGTAITSFHFAGQQTDQVTGLVNLRARSYDPRNGRFISQDQMVQCASGTQGFNRYGYTANNPMRFTDPSGYLSGEDVADWIEGHLLRPLAVPAYSVAPDGQSGDLCELFLQAAAGGDGVAVPYIMRGAEVVVAVGGTVSTGVLVVRIVQGVRILLDAGAVAEDVTATAEQAGEGRLTAIAQGIRTSATHAPAINQRTIAVGVDTEGRLWAGSSNRFDAGQRAALDRLGVTLGLGAVMHFMPKKGCCAACLTTEGRDLRSGSMWPSGAQLSPATYRCRGWDWAVSAYNDVIATTAYDVILDELASGINRLSKRSVVALYWGCAEALLPEFLRWAAHCGESTDLLLREALEAAYRFAAFGTEPVHADRLLWALEASTPPGDSPDEFSSTAAQDCWFCADICIRVLVDAHYKFGPVIEYALESIAHKATEELFGVSQLGGGDAEEAEMLQVVDHPSVAAALDFLRWAINFLGDHPSPENEDLELLHSRSRVLAP
jgi:RHS repeat-associated protein